MWRLFSVVGGLMRRLKTKVMGWSWRRRNWQGERGVSEERRDGQPKFSGCEAAGKHEGIPARGWKRKNSELLKATVKSKKVQFTDEKLFFSQTNRKKSPEWTRGRMAACGCFIPELNVESYTPVGESTRGPGTDDLTFTPQQPKVPGSGRGTSRAGVPSTGTGPVIIGTRGPTPSRPWGAARAHKWDLIKTWILLVLGLGIIKLYPMS